MQTFQRSLLCCGTALAFLVACPHDLWASAQLTSFGATSSSPPPSTAPKQTGRLPVSTKTSVAIPAGSVFCGIDLIFDDGFESPSFTPIQQMPGGAASPGQTQDITGTGSLGVTITSPVGGTTGDSTVDVSGTFVGPVNTGITVNGASGFIVNGSFLVPNVPLAAGNNSLSAIATILPGATASYTGSISQGGAAPAIAIKVNHPTDYAPASMTFSYVIGSLPSGNPVQTIKINFKGSGSPDFTGSSLSNAPTAYTYSQPGLYTASLQVTDTQSNTYTAYRSVLIQDLNAQRGMLCDVYGYLQSQLTAATPSASNAALAFQPIVQNQYLSLFNSLGSANMKLVGQQLGFIASGLLGQGFVEFLVVRDNADQSRNGFPVRLTQGADGVWRISEL